MRVPLAENLACRGAESRKEYKWLRWDRLPPVKAVVAEFGSCRMLTPIMSAPMSVLSRHKFSQNSNLSLSMFLDSCVPYISYTVRIQVLCLQ